MVVIGHLKHNVVDSYNWILKQFQQVNAKCLPKHDQKFLSVPLQHLLKSSLAMRERFSILKGFHCMVTKNKEPCLHTVYSDYVDVHCLLQLSNEIFTRVHFNRSAAYCLIKTAKLLLLYMIFK